MRSILSMGVHLGLQVVAEGVETSAQSSFLALHGRAHQQGWLHGRPQPVERFLAGLCTRDAEAGEALALR